jgi:hypothetical protein
VNATRLTAITLPFL